MSNQVLVLATQRFEYLADELVASQSRYRAGTLLNDVFPQGERRLEVAEFDAVRDAEVILIGGTEREDLFDLMMYAGEVAQVAKRLNILIPFFRYATQERKDHEKPGHIIIAKGIARTISMLPRAAQGNRIFLVDPHTESLAQYFDDTRIRAEIIRCFPLLSEVIQREIPGRLEDKVIASVDDGRPAVVKDVAATLNLPFALLDKERVSGTETRVLGGINGDVAGKTVVMVDDMARTLGSALGAAVAYRDAGANAVWLVATHPDYSASAVPDAAQAGLLEGVLTGNGYPGISCADGQFARSFAVAEYLGSVLGEQFAL